MSEVEALRDFGRFWAAAVYDVSSATDVSDISEATIAGEASTDLLHLRMLPLLCVVADCSSPSVSTDTVGAGSAPAEMGASDFEILDELHKPEERIRRQIRAFRNGSRLFYREYLARRLDFLLREFEEEEEAWAAESFESLQQMLLFLEAMPYFRCPTVSVTPLATFRAQWRGASNERLAADFLPDGQVRFVVFAPDPRHPDRAQRVSGIVSREDLVASVEPYRVQRWAADAGP